MPNHKYYKDIKTFPDQFQKGFEIASSINFKGNFSKIIICGMGGSSYYTELINDFLGYDLESPVTIIPNRKYTLPNWVDSGTLIILASYSGNTEETLECAKEVLKRRYKAIVFASGGELEKFANENKLPLFLVPGGIQPRLSSGYYVAGVLKILKNLNLVKFEEPGILDVASKLEQNLDEEYAKRLAKGLKDKLPIIYAPENIKSITRIAKIKINENSKVQAFANYFPELNHNEMVGYTKLVTNPFFLIFNSKFAHPRNKKRIEVFKEIMKNKNLPVEIVELSGKTQIAEILNAYYLIDHITYYLAGEYDVDPEPVDMVEEFKHQL